MAYSVKIRDVKATVSMERKIFLKNKRENSMITTP